MEFYEILCGCELFKQLDMTQIECILDSLNPRTADFKKGEVILTEGALNREIGIVLSGGIVAQKLSVAGSATTVSEIGTAGVFGEILSGSATRSPVTVVTASDSKIMFITFDSLIDSSFECASAQKQLIRNLILMISQAYFSLQKRVSLLTSGNLRRRISEYLLHYAKDDIFTVPHSREQMAGYLGCDRSALSRELSRMKKEGLIEFERKKFAILNRSSLEQ